MKKQTQTLKQLRADLDLLIILGGQVILSREASLAYTKLQEGKMHIGNALYELDAAKIYTESKNPGNANIEPYHVDQEIKAMETPEDWHLSAINEISKVKIMRRELDFIVGRIKELATSTDYMNTICAENMFATFFVTESLVRVRESMNWYGMVLGKIRDSQPATI